MQLMPLRSSEQVSHMDAVEAELCKDIWDCWALPGVRYAAHKTQRYLNFTRIPALFRPVLKRYFKMLIVQFSLSECMRKLWVLGIFIAFFTERHPAARDFEHLSRADIEAYLLYLKTRPNRYGRTTSQEHMWVALHGLKQFLEYLERTSSPEAPLTPVWKLIWPNDVSKKIGYDSREVKYIPDLVLRQLEQHMHHLPAKYLPVVILLRASGWRISDILNLRYESCLQRTASGWWLCGDIAKTNILNHKIPISDEIAALVTAQCRLVKNTYDLEANPKGYLFPASTHQRRGRPLFANSVQNALNRLAITHDIRDETGTIFHFKTHAFRHTKGVELINNGMSLTHVQKWLAHLSPEMTLVYAKLLDTTMRQEWEQAFAKGAVRIDGAGEPKVVSTGQLSTEQEIEWEHIRHNLDAVRLPNGYCFKPKKAHCPTQETPCYTCHHFCTTADFLPQFEREEREMRELIELGQRAGSPIWVERNTQKLNRLLPVIEVLKSDNLHHPAGKTMREYTPEERAKGG